MRRLALVSLCLLACNGTTNQTGGVGPSATTGPSGVSGVTGPSGASGKTIAPPTIEDPSDLYSGDAHALLTLTFAASQTTFGSSTSISPGILPTTETSTQPYNVLSCTQTVDGCEVYKNPSCAPACAAGFVCLYDATCKAKCQATNACTSNPCKTDEYCVLESGKEVCKTQPAFDAGKLKITGLTKPVSFSFPYEMKQSSADPLFEGGESVKVAAPGASEDAGFEAFNMDHKIVKALSTELSKLVANDVIKGTGDVVVKWTKGSDAIQVAGGGGKGGFFCKADDTKGTFTVTRGVLNEVLESSATNASLVVTRSNYSLKTGLKLKGKLTGVEIPAEGWAYVSSSMSEISALLLPGPTGVTGPSGLATCEACINNAKTNACATEYNACVAVASCKGLVDCLTACTGGDFTCYSTCYSSHPDNSGKALAAASCVSNACSSSCPQ